MNPNKKSILEEFAERAGRSQDTMPTEPTETALNNPEEKDLIEYLTERIKEQEEPEEPEDHAAQHVAEYVKHIQRTFDYYLYMVEKLADKK